MDADPRCVSCFDIPGVVFAEARWLVNGWREGAPPGPPVGSYGDLLCVPCLHEWTAYAVSIGRPWRLVGRWITTTVARPRGTPAFAAIYGDLQRLDDIQEAEARAREIAGRPDPRRAP